MWSPDSLSTILASVEGGSWLVVRNNGHKQFGPRNWCRLRYSSHISGVTRLLSSTGLPSSLVLSLRDSQYKNKHTRRRASVRTPKDRMLESPGIFQSDPGGQFDTMEWTLAMSCLASGTKTSVEYWRLGPTRTPLFNNDWLESEGHVRSRLRRLGLDLP